ncbi:hypothetical protein [Pseudohoeflea coraliihabitans]|uniref:Uncharacterized protein n=1 Tax=Pseudohoeflea coraliihabitans TaxID=2860393 RepID=A0ABS6WPV0_9HYPH|nr:hypothetical protein [Pseudohoeflea sp. DP4N28-3]MBW3097407.1 hypothetical protein [Pseudohoeflea sp. DP4N28-3]
MKSESEVDGFEPPPGNCVDAAALFKRLSTALGFAIVACLIPGSLANAAVSERSVQQCVCQGMDTEVALESGARADCVSATHAIEVDKTAGWAQAIGQALHYAQQTGKRPKIILYCEDRPGLCLARKLRLEETLAFASLSIDLETVDDAVLSARCGR